MADNSDNESTCRLLTQIESRHKLTPYYCEKLATEIFATRIAEDGDAALVVQALIVMEPDITLWDGIETLGCLVARRSWPNSLGLLLDAGLSPNSTDTRKPSVGRSLLMEAVCNCSRLDTASMLIERGADIEQVDKSGETAIFWASFMSNRCAVRMLLECGANALRVDKQGHTPLFNCFVSVEEANPDDVLSCAKQLLDAGVDPFAQNTSGETAMVYADSYGGPISHGFRALVADHSAGRLARDTASAGGKGSQPRM